MVVLIHFMVIISLCVVHLRKFQLFCMCKFYHFICLAALYSMLQDLSPIVLQAQTAMSNAFPSLRVVVLTRRFQVPFLIGLGLRPTNYCHQQKICSGHQFAIKVKFTTICFALLSLYISKQERDWKSPFDLNFQNTLLEISYNYFLGW